MDQLTGKRQFVRKVGQQVPESITRLMRSRHPTVELMWEANAMRWCLTQTVRAQTFLITILHKRGAYVPPTLANTVYYLDAIHPSRFASDSAKKKLLEGLDQSDEADSVEQRSRDQIAEGSKDIFDLMTHKKQFRIQR